MDWGREVGLGLRGLIWVERFDGGIERFDGGIERLDGGRKVGWNA